MNFINFSDSPSLGVSISRWILGFVFGALVVSSVVYAIKIYMDRKNKK